MKKSFITVLLVIGIIFTMSMVVFADTPDLSELLNNSNSTETTNTTSTTTTTTTTTTLNENTNSNVNINSNENVNLNVNNTNETPSKLANTGLGFNTIVLMAITAVAAVYAHKKVKEYNV